MPDAQSTFTILLKTVADVTGLNQLKTGVEGLTGKVGEVQSGLQEAAAGSSEIFESIGSLLGVGIGGGIAAGVVAVVGEVIQLVREQAEFNEKLKIANQLLVEQEAEWLILAQNASKFTDVVALGLKMIPELKKLQDQFNETATKPLGNIRSIVDALLTTPLTTGPFTAAQQQQLKAQKDLLDLTKQRDFAEIKVGEDAVAAWEKLKTIPVKDAIQQVTANLEGLRSEQAKLGAETVAPDVEGYTRINQQLAIQQEHLDFLNKKLGAQVEIMTDIKDKTAVATAQASGDKEAVSAVRAAQAYDRVKASLIAKGVPEAEAVRLAKEYEQATLRAEQARGGAARGTDQLAIANLHLRETAVAYRVELERVKLLEDQGAISVVAGDAQKRAATLQYLSALSQVRAELQRDLIAAQARGDAKAVAELTLQMERLRLAGLKGIGDLANTTAWGKIRLQLIQLKNEWGDVGKQVGQFLTQAIQNFASTASQALTALIFRTGNLKQAFASLIQSMVQGLIQLGIQLVISALLGKILGEQAGQTQTGPGAAAFAAWEPAAIAADTATFGAASAAALISFGAAVLGGQAFGAIGHFLKGGFTGEGSDDQPAGVVHRGEFVFPAPRVRALTREFLEMLHGGVAFARPYQGGGFAGPGSGGIPVGAGSAGSGSGDVHVFIFHDLREAVAAYQKSSAGRKEFRSLSRKNKI